MQKHGGLITTVAVDDHHNCRFYHIARRYFFKDIECILTVYMYVPHLSGWGFAVCTVAHA